MALSEAVLGRVRLVDLVFINGFVSCGKLGSSSSSLASSARKAKEEVEKRKLGSMLVSSAGSRVSFLAPACSGFSRKLLMTLLAVFFLAGLVCSEALESVVE